MRAAGLKAISTVVESTAILIKSKHPSDPKMVDLIASRIRGVISKFAFDLMDLSFTRVSPPCFNLRAGFPDTLLNTYFSSNLFHTH